MIFILPCPSEELISVAGEKRQTKYIPQEKHKSLRELGFLIIHGRHDFFFPSACGTELPSCQSTLYIGTHSSALFFLCYNPENSSFSQGNQNHSTPMDVCFSLAYKDEFSYSKQHVKPHIQTAVVQWLYSAIQHKILYVGNFFLFS